MIRSDKRILTTHAGSLPRPAALVEMLGKKSRNEPLDERALDELALAATRDVVAHQLEAGIDVGNNGEQSRESFFTYVQHRMSGFSGRGDRPFMRDIVHYPSFLALRRELLSRIRVDLLHPPKATGDVKYTGAAQVKKECDDFRRILAGQKKSFAEPFMTAPSPGIIAAAMLNEHYPTLADYVNALADALAVEYRTIVDAGYVLQIDAPDLAMERHTSFAARPLSDFVNFIDTVVAATNRALTGIAPDRVRLHVCWGNYEGPHDDDVALDDIVEHLYPARVGAILLSMANPRHEHEYRCFARHRLPESMSLIVGAIDTTTNYIEHPEVVADRIERAAKVIGDPRRIMAATDCGFDTSAGLGEVAGEVVWLKLRALADGAAIASKRLFG